MLIFALRATRELGAGISRALGVELAPHEEREFEDGEHKARPLMSVRGRDLYLVQSLYGGPEASPSDKLCRLLFFAGALRDAGAGRVTAVVPYLAYARKDRRTQLRDPITTRYVAQLIEAVGVDRVVVVDVHNLAAFENAFRCPTIASRRGRSSSPTCCRFSASRRWSLFRRTLAAPNVRSCSAKRSPGRSVTTWRWPSWRSGGAVAP
jgi:ribose-phosphate pyrophosphokinase